MGAIIWYIIVGAIIGALARLFMKGEQPMGIVWTIILGALGAGIGGWIAGAIGVGSVLEWVISILVAMGLISLYLSFAAKKN
ncbi:MULTISPECIES: GlsB/YeaQ/YmgE family stress response membrane protein [Actinomyces]|uniref:GlsB/YeaQ/YmgE family stress response membrane protein n=1 Tax=Actinomyces TaxID=1654 RepID=UPI00093170C3|nr:MULTISPECIES: transglycosylase [Actinomyces]MDU6680113.1 GlsB/YeaQ/YmgE family stress response membrane protein [Actinomyces sp.]